MSTSDDAVDGVRKMGRVILLLVLLVLMLLVSLFIFSGLVNFIISGVLAISIIVVSSKLKKILR